MRFDFLEALSNRHARVANDSSAANMLLTMLR